MKRCVGCNVIYEDSFDVCPTCGDTLDVFGGEQRNNSSPQYQNNTNPRHTPQRRQTSNNSAYIFEQKSGSIFTINGSVAESNTQQYYQSRLTKLWNAIFFGEPYQLGHTSFVTIFRVEEHTTRGYPEQARDIVLYGNMQNIFATGDDVTLSARKKGSRLVADRVFNHSINDYIKLQFYIPASIISFFVLIAVIVVILIINGIINADYSAIGSAITGFISSALSFLIVIAFLWYIIKGRFKR